jgi:putative pyruvate formate lyase activating enzyme
MKHPASYTYLSASEWDERIAAAHALSSPCMLCPRACRADRTGGQTGYCGANGELYISSIFPHHGEEPPISGTNGSGTVFFSHCSLRCCFCQNFQISQENEGEPYSAQRLAKELLFLQKTGVHNVNLVSATHYVPWVLRTLKEAAAGGLDIPLVWNSSGYEIPQALSILSGIVDIYLPDMKYGSNDSAKRYSNAPNYVEANRAAIREMFRQVGPLRTDSNDIAYRGMCIRHLVLPQARAASSEVFDFLKSTFDPTDLTISLMAQFRPLYRASEHPELTRSVTREEYETVLVEAEEAGFNIYPQELLELDDSFCIDFAKRKHEPLTGSNR